MQDALANAVKGFCGETATAYGAGRTDTGVHARGQVAHLDLEQEVRPDKLRDAMNHHLKPLPVAVTQAAYARADFDARFFRPWRGIIDIAFMSPRAVALDAACLVRAERIGAATDAGGSAGFSGAA